MVLVPPGWVLPITPPDWVRVGATGQQHLQKTLHNLEDKLKSDKNDRMKKCGQSSLVQQAALGVRFDCSNLA